MSLHPIRLAILVLPALVALPLAASAQAPAPAPAPGTQPVAKPLPIITREDLAEAYLRVERALHKHPPEARHRAAAHRAMDRAAYQFFTADHSGAIQTMNELADSLRRGVIEVEGVDVEHNEPAPPDWKCIMRSMRVRVAPRIANVHRPSIFNVRISPLYTTEIPEPLHLRLVVREDRPGGKIVFEQAVEIRGDSALPSISTKQPDARPGTYRVQLIEPGVAGAAGEAGEAREAREARENAMDVGRWFVVDQSLDLLRSNNERLMGTIELTDVETYQALVACRSRNALLSDRISEAESAQFLSNPVELSREVQEEVAALRKGVNPYDGRTGDFWRAIPAGAMHIPSRVYAPEQVKEGKPMPLVIALHGAGADENAFMQAYGAGAIKRLADEHGFVVVAPSSYWVMPNPSALNGIVETMSVNYPIDPSRVYLIGHSLGASAAVGMATRQPDDVAAAVLIAGGKFPPSAKICPTLMLAAEMDPIIPPHQLEGVAVEAKEQGSRVEFRLLRDAGHVLVVGAALPEAIDWLLAHRAGE